jgi:hypothetical protein
MKVLYRYNFPYSYVDVSDIFIHFTTYDNLQNILLTGEIKSCKINVQFAYNLDLSLQYPCWACLPTDRVEVAVLFTDNVEDWEFYNDECLTRKPIVLRDYIIVDAQSIMEELKCIR